MPARTDVQKEIDTLRKSAQDIVRRKYLAELSGYTKRDTIIYASGSWSAAKKSAQMPQWVFSITQEDIQGFMGACHQLNGTGLDLVLHSPGGQGDAAEQIVNYLRAKYSHIRAIIPQAAMSAATMLACACDVIVMGKESALGPVDPQINLPTANGQMMIAAHALLSEFDQAKAEVSADPKLAPIWATKIKAYPPGILSACTTAASDAQEKVEGWLKKYMLSGEPEAAEKAKAIAIWLSSADHHKSHGHPINFDMAQSRGLKVVRLEDDSQLQDLALSVFHASMYTLDITNVAKFIENQNGKGWFLQVASKTP